MKEETQIELGLTSYFRRSFFSLSLFRNAYLSIYIKY